MKIIKNLLLLLLISLITIPITHAAVAKSRRKKGPTPVKAMPTVKPKEVKPTPPEKDPALLAQIEELKKRILDSEAASKATQNEKDKAHQAKLIASQKEQLEEKERLAAELTVLEKERNRLADQAAQATAQKDVFENELKQLQITREQTQLIIQNIKIEKDLITKKSSAQEAELNNRETIIEELETEVKTVNSDNSRTKDENISLINKQAENKSTYEDQTRELKTKNNELESLKNEVAELKTKSEDLQTKLTANLEKINELAPEAKKSEGYEEKFRQSQELVRTLGPIIVSVGSQLSELDRAAAQSAQIMGQKDTKLAQAEKNAEKLEEEVKTRETTLESVKSDHAEKITEAQNAVVLAKTETQELSKEYETAFGIEAQDEIANAALRNFTVIEEEFDKFIGEIEQAQKLAGIREEAVQEAKAKLKKKAKKEEAQAKKIKEELIKGQSTQGLLPKSSTYTPKSSALPSGGTTTPIQHSPSTKN